jgi:cell division protein FtsI/penicillin-binding protein 2
MNRKILDPRWANQEKTHIIAKFQYDDGKLVTASISNPEGEINPDWKEIIDTFGEKTLDDNTNFALQVHYQNKQQKQEQQKLHIERMQQQALQVEQQHHNNQRKKLNQY